MVMNYSGIKQHTYLNMLVKSVHKLSYMFIQMYWRDGIE